MLRIIRDKIYLLHDSGLQIPLFLNAACTAHADVNSNLVTGGGSYLSIPALHNEHLQFYTLTWL